MSHRGVTLLELLIAIALVVSVAAIAVVAMDQTLGRRQFERTVELVREQMQLARAHAERTGEPVELLYFEEKNLLRTQRLLVNDVLPDDESPAFESDDNEWGSLRDDRIIEEPWSEQAWPDQFSLTTTDPRLPDMDFGDPRDDGSFIGPSDTGVRIAVLLPDGTASGGSDLYLSDGRTRLMLLAVNDYLATLRTTPLSMDDPIEAFESMDDDAAEASFDEAPEARAATP
ncbi:MAG: prepilin-type N-terminal cleavage/methylation domain-containing protein [Planctomycetota bacterium]